MTARYLWTLQRADSDLHSGLATADELTAILTAESLPGVAPADWIVTGLILDEDENGAALHTSPLGWSLSLKRMLG